MSALEHRSCLRISRGFATIRVSFFSSRTTSTDVSHGRAHFALHIGRQPCIFEEELKVTGRPIELFQFFLTQRPAEQTFPLQLRTLLADGEFGKALRRLL